MQSPCKVLWTLTCLAIAGLLLNCSGNQQPNLQELEREVFFAATQQDSLHVAKQIFNYFFDRKAISEIEQKIAFAIENAVERGRKEDGRAWNLAKEGVDPEHIARHFYRNGFLGRLAVARLASDSSKYSSLLIEARRLAVIADRLQQHAYWQNFVESAFTGDPSKSLAWLRAKIALDSLKAEADSNIPDLGKVENWAAVTYSGIRQSGDQRIAADMMHKLTWVLRQRNAPGCAYLFAKSALSELRSLSYPIRIAGFEYYLGDIAFDLRKYNLAKLHYERAVKIARSAQQGENISFYEHIALLQIAELNSHILSGETALQVLRAMPVRNLRPKHKILWFMRMGHAHLRVNHPEAALAYFDSAGQAAMDSGDKRNAFLAHVNAGAVYNNNGNPYKAEAQYKIAYERMVPELYGTPAHRLYLNNWVSLLLSQGRQTEAESFLQQQSHALGRQNGNADYLRTMGRLHLRLKNYENAIKLLNAATAQYESNGAIQNAFNANLMLTDASRKAGQFEFADSVLTAAEQIAGKSTSVENRIEVLGERATLALDQKQPDLARKHIAALQDALTTLQSNLRDASLQKGFEQKVYQYLKVVPLAYLAKNSPREAFQALGELKGRALRRSLASTDSETREFRKVITAPEGDLILDFLTTNKTLYAFMQKDDSISVFSTPFDPDQVSRHISILNDLIAGTPGRIRASRSPVRKESSGVHFQRTQSVADSVAAMIIPWPVLRNQITEARALYVIKDTGLHDVPLPALVLRNEMNSFFLGQLLPVFASPSRSLIQKRTANLLGPDARVLISADYASFKPAEALVNKWKNKFEGMTELALDEEKFSTAGLKAELDKRYDLIIIISHGKSDELLPDSSYVDLAVWTNGRAHQKIMRVTAEDFRSMESLNTRMVMLIGCQTGVGRVFRGDGNASIARELTALGIPIIWANRWKVNTYCALHQADHFLASLSEGNDFYKAYFDAQRKTFEDNSLLNLFYHPHPYMWAGLEVQRIN